MSTLDRAAAAKGLRMVHRYRALTMPILWTFRILPRACNFARRQLANVLDPFGLHIRPPSTATLRWSKDVTVRRRERVDSNRGRLMSEVHMAGHSPAKGPFETENVPLIVEPDFAYLHSPPGNRTPGSSNDRSISPTTRSNGLSTPER